MSAVSLLVVVGVVLWVGLVVVAQLLTPEQSALRMGLSGLATGRHGWLMKLAYIVRGITAVALVVVLVGALAAGPVLVAGIVLLVLWAVCSALLIVFDTDMPGDEPTRHGALHALLAGVSYVAVAVGMLLVSLGLRGQATAVARWALPIALLAAVAVFVQFAGFGAAARAAAAGGVVMDDVDAGGSVVAGAPGDTTRGVSVSGLGRYAGLLQRVFLGLVMLWTAVVAVGV